MISAGGVLIDDHGGKPAYRVRAGQRVRVVLPEIPRQAPRPEEIPLEILFEDEDLVVVNKPPGMVVHPARGHWSGTLVSALQFHFGPSLSSSGGPLRPGIVHRLDRDTSGAILVARHDQAHSRLAIQFQSRSIEKEYFAIVVGTPEMDSDIIDRSIAVHPQHREKMTTVRDDDEGRTAQTFYQRGRAVSRIRRGAGDAEDRPDPSDSRSPGPYRPAGALRSGLRASRGTHARRAQRRLRRHDGPAQLARPCTRGDCGSQHPRSGELLEIEAPLPADLEAVLGELRKYRK